MKYLLLTLLLILTGCEKLLEPEVYEGKLVERDNLFYKPNSLEPFTGEKIDWYENGQLKAKGSFIDGKRDGFWEFRKEWGMLEEKGNYIDGNRDGLWEGYHTDGGLRTTVSYIDGKREGPWESTWNNGSLRQKGNYINGEKDGLWEYYLGEGKFDEKGNYIDGKKDGVWEAWHENGQLKSRGNYTGGRENGPWEFYYKNGHLSEKGNFIDGKKDGLWEYYEEKSSELTARGNYKRGLVTGIYYRYQYDKIAPYCYQNGEQVDQDICFPECANISKPSDEYSQCLKNFSTTYD